MKPLDMIDCQTILWMIYAIYRHDQLVVVSVSYSAIYVHENHPGRSEKYIHIHKLNACIEEYENEHEN